MISIGSKIFRKPLNSIPISKLNLNNSQKLKETPLIDNIKKGYNLIEKTTNSKTRYIILNKDSNKSYKYVLYYIHGGFYTKGLTSIYELFIYPLCDLNDDLEIVLLDYSLAPKNKYPTQLNEAFDVWNELLTNFKSENIIIGSDSSGGNIALSLLQKLVKENYDFPKAAFFISPMTDMTCSGKSYFTNYKKDVNFGNPNATLTKEKLNEFKNSEIFSFIGDVERKDPFISPIFGDYFTFPKSLFIVGGDEMLLNDTLDIVEKIKENKNDVELIVKEGMSHNYPLYMNFIPEGYEAYNKIKQFITESLS